MESTSESPIPLPSELDSRHEVRSVDSAEMIRETQTLGPMDGGRWRPVRPDELLRKQAAVPSDKKAPEPPKVQLQRRQELEQHLKTWPADLDATLELARIYRSDDRPIEARRVIQQAIQFFPKEERLTVELEEATLARSRQQLREVAELASRLNTPEVAQALKRSQTDWAMRRMDVCRARLARDPQQKQLHLILAEALFDSGMFEATVEELKKIVEIDEISPHAYLLMGRAYLALGKDIEAMPALRAASIRRAVPAPIRVRVIALRLLCEVAERLGTTMTLQRYRQHLTFAEQELSKLS
jgi:hypothetical protein